MFYFEPLWLVTISLVYIFICSEWSHVESSNRPTAAAQNQTKLSLFLICLEQNLQLKPDEVTAFEASTEKISPSCGLHRPVSGHSEGN